jgi:hypothetical protein
MQITIPHGLASSSFALSSPVFLCVLCASVVNHSSLLSAPPAVTYLFPAGGQRGTAVEVTAAGSFERWPVRAWVSGHGVTATPGKDKGKLTVTVAADAEPGTRWVRLFDEQGASAPRPFLVGTLPEVAEQEPNDDPKHPQVLPGPAVTVNGRLGKPGDVDCFAVTCRQGQTLVADLEANSTLRSPMDAVLQVVSPDGFVLAENNDFRGLDPRIVYPVPHDGTYVVRTFAFPATPDSSIRFAGAENYVYRLTVTTGGFADYPVPLAVARAAPGAVDLVGWNLPDAARRLPVPVPEVGDEATLAHPALANRVRVRLEPHPCVVRPSGAGPFAVTPPVSVTARLDRPGAADVYRIAAKKGQRLTVQAQSRALGLPVAGVLRLTDEAGKELVRAEPAGLDKDAELAFTPPTDGAYLLTVRDQFGGGGPRSAYLLRVAPDEPDFTLALKSDRFTLAAGQALDVPVAVTRRGFTADIELSVEGLPPGVRAAVTARTPAQITLRLTAAADVSWSGPIRIVGRGGPVASRLATATPADGGEPIADLWLTVPRK